MGKKLLPRFVQKLALPGKIGKECGKIRIFRVLSYFSPIFSLGPISGPISGAIFSYFGPEARNPFFYQVGRFSIHEDCAAGGQREFGGLL